MRITLISVPYIPRQSGLGDVLALVALDLAAAHADRVHAALIALRLGGHLTIAVDLTCGGHQQPGSHASGQAQHVLCGKKTRLGAFDRLALVVHRRGR